MPTREGEPGSDVHTMYCPMVKKSWLQKGDKVRNPYLRQGDERLRREEEEGQLASKSGDRMEIRCERRVLDNGLSVLVHEDRTCPIVAVNVWYHVGSKNERPGRTGLAHCSST